MMDKDKDRYWDCLDHAMEASHGGRLEEALAWLEEALKVHPTGAEAHNGRGEILWDEGRIEEAVCEFERSILADSKFSAAHLNRIELLIEEAGEYELALKSCDALLTGGSLHPRLDRSFQAEVCYLKAKSLFYQDDLEGAIFLIRRAIKCAGDQPTYRGFEGHILFEKGDCEGARRVLERAVVADPDSSHMQYSLGLVLERVAAGYDPNCSGRDAEAALSASAAAFSRAHAIDPVQFPRPLSVSDEVFRAAVDDALANLPRSIREIIEGVPKLVEDYPSNDLVIRDGVSPQTLGIFKGVPRTQAVVTDQRPDLDHVILFKSNLEKTCRDEQELVEQIQVTMRHEIGHYLGLDESDLDRLGLA